MSGELARDERGAPVLLAANAPRGVTGPGGNVVPSTSGNPAHVPAGQPGGGRFGTRVGGAPSTQQGPRAPAGVQPEEWARRLDAVREAAREFETFSAQDISEWLRGKTTRPLTDDEIKGFMADVRAQQLTDLVDILDQGERGSRRQRRHVRVFAPRGYTRKTLNSLQPDELKLLVQRLRSRGWTSKQVKGLAKRLPEARRPELDGLADRLVVPTDLF